MPTTNIADVNFTLEGADLVIEYDGLDVGFSSYEVQDIVDFLTSPPDRLTAIEARLVALESAGVAVQGRDEPLKFGAPATEVIGTAVDEGLKVRFKYRGAFDTVATERVVTPVMIHASSSSEYFEGSYEGGGYRRFNLDGIDGPVLLDA